MKKSLNSSGNSWNWDNPINKSNISADNSIEKSFEEEKYGRIEATPTSTKASDHSISDERNTTSSPISNPLYHSNSTFSVTQFLDKVDTDEDIKSKRLKVINKIKEICDIFNKYSYQDRANYLEEMHLILRLLIPQEIIDHVLPSFTIFVEEKDALKLKFLDILPMITDYLISEDYEAAIDQIILNVFPTLESMLKKSTEEIQDQ